MAIVMLLSKLLPLGLHGAMSVERLGFCTITVRFLGLYSHRIDVGRRGGFEMISQHVSS